ncbi:hypothetical protein, partial [Legionella sainthelensi]
MPTVKKLDWNKVARAANKAGMAARAALTSPMIALGNAANTAYEGTIDALSNAAQWTKDTGWPAVKKAAISAYEGTRDALS